MNIVFWIGVITSITTGIMHIVGSYSVPKIDGGYYRRFWWWDTLAHFLGGLSIVIFAAVLSSTMTTGLYRDALTLSIVLVVGLLWEAYEFLFWNEHEKGPYMYPEDTALDVAVELLAAFALLHADIYWNVIP